MHRARTLVSPAKWTRTATPYRRASVTDCVPCCCEPCCIAIYRLFKNSQSVRRPTPSDGSGSTQLFCPLKETMECGGITAALTEILRLPSVDLPHRPRATVCRNASAMTVLLLKTRRCNRRVRNDAALDEQLPAPAA